MTDMDFLELAKRRCSVRAFEGKGIEQEKFDKILEAGRVAPTAANKQPQRIVAVRTKEGLEKLKKAANVYGAPLALIVCADHSTSWKRPLDGKDTADIDASIVTTHMMLEAADLGLGTIWVCYFKAGVVSEEFGLPASLEPINILGVGYAAQEARSPDRHATERLPLAETVSQETF
jgi:nitroreductase